MACQDDVPNIYKGDRQVGGGFKPSGLLCGVEKTAAKCFFHFLRKDLYTFWASSGIFQKRQDFSTYKKLPYNTGQTKRNCWMEKESCALPFRSGVKTEPTSKSKLWKRFAF